MVMHGHPSTITASIEMMCIHTQAVARGAGGKLVVADMPFLSYRKGVAPALDAAQALMQAGAQALKLEGVDGHEDVVDRLVHSGIPVMGHLGLQPQSLHRYGGYRIQGRDGEAAARIETEAKRLENLGAFALVLECIPAELAAEITAALRIPVIGIGAGAGCDGQILVLQDLLGMNIDFQPKFVRRFGDAGKCVLDALTSFDKAVKSGAFPDAAESYE
jgi:3-methyl-2-oxobutanoate hydroxymethyltransferase